VLPFVARHSSDEVARGLAAFSLSGLRPTMLPIPRAALYELWNTFGAAGPGQFSKALRAADVVHAPSLAVPPRRATPLVVSVHDAAPIIFPATYNRHGRWFHNRGYAAAAARADAIIAPTAAAADEIAQWTKITRDRIRVVHHGVAPAFLTPGSETRARAKFHLGSDPYVLWVGTLEPRKNVATLVDAFTLFVEKSDAPPRLVLVGPDGWMGAGEEIREAARALGDLVRLTGPVAPADLAALYRGAEVFALPSVHEGFGLPALEAMAQDTAVLLADIPALREVGGDGARYVNARDAEAWAVALLDLLGDDAERRALGERGARRAAEFDWKRCVAATVAVYREIAR
jgi:glycosyltransferase involved in cell wall biosynthesis